VPRIAVCGGPYANPHALRAWLTDARARGAERLFCLGDLGGFGAECDAVWPLLVEHGVESIAGNYDIAIGRGDEDCGCGYSDERDNHFAQLMYDYTRAHTAPEFAAWMRTLPGERRETLGGVDVQMVHGSPLAINDFLWESLDDDELRLRLRAGDPGPAPAVLLCTHTGLPWQRQVDGTLIVNVGTVGRPANDGRPQTWYALLDLEDGGARADLVALDYDWRAHAAAMRAAGLPEPFVETVETGWWTTCLEVVPPLERSRGRYHVYRDALPSGFAAEGVGWAQAPEPADDGLPVMALFGSEVFPPRLWIYSNFHCNLACEYCVVASSPRARRRSIGAERFRALIDEAVDEGFAEVYVTGGEPFIEPRIVEMLEYASDRLPTVVLTNAMLFTGRRRTELARLARRANLVLQSSIDGARAQTHDAWRGAGSWKRAMQGLAYARELGLPMRVAMTETPENREEVDELRELLATLDIVGDDFAVRPLVKRGFAEGVEDGMEVSEPVIVPELTVTADGVHWHPIGGDVDSSPDMLVAAGSVSLAEGKRAIVERFLALRLEDGSLPAAFQCAI
jgi:pyruvate-formate lyase-activating enzyme/diadenosine tetraphosphatase ApaH/serine/threonine PP2A family protein phosphatase